MCGIVGAVGSLYFKEEKAFRYLLELDTTRGHHSTGILRSGFNGDWETLKQVGTPWDLYKEERFGKLWAKTHKLLLGHNRWATKGSITADNAHPFVQGDFIGVHNGTLDNQSLLPDHKFFDVDSENIYHSFNVDGVATTLEKLHGAFALAWFDASEKKFQFVRNDKRPLSYAFSTDMKTFFLASEPWMLHVALSKAGVNHHPVHEVEVGKLYSLNVPKTYQEELNLVKTDVKFYDPKAAWNKKKEQQKEKVESGHSTSSSTSQPTNVSLLNNYMGLDVVFSVVGWKETNSQKYILCQVEDITNAELRIFIKEDTPLYKQLMTTTSFLSGNVKSWVRSGNSGYLKVDHRTIREVEVIEQGESANDDYFEGFNKMQLSAAQWYDRVSPGCEVCQKFPTPDQKDSLVWLAPQEHICAECACTLAGREYLNNY